jgi:hypothetical protein
MPDVVDPFVVAKNPQGLSNCLVDAGGPNFNRMFNLLEIETGHFAGLQGHDQELSCFAFSSPEEAMAVWMSEINQDRYKRKSGRLEEGESPFNARFK